MFSLNKNKKRGFTLAEIMVTLGLVGAISAMVIPTLAYNYKAKVLEQQFRDTYAEIKQIGSMINYEKGDVGEYAAKYGINTTLWAQDFMSRISGGNALCDYCRSGTNPSNTAFKRNLYKQAGSAQGPYAFNLNNAGRKEQVGDICHNGGVWTDSKGRIWSFNQHNKIICVDINGTANPNRINIDTFAFIPMTAEQAGAFLYNDLEHPENYSGQFAVCDLARLQNKADTLPERDDNNKYIVNKEDPQSALDLCPFNEPLENIAALNSLVAGKSARNRNMTSRHNYWKDYIDYK